MNVKTHAAMASARAARQSEFRWPAVDGRDDDAVWVRVTGGAAADRSDELWNALEVAFEQAEGRVVVIDLSAVSAFDTGTMAILTSVSRQAARWHLAVWAVVAPASPIGQYVQHCGLDEFLTMRSTEAEVRAGLRHVEATDLLLPGPAVGFSGLAEANPSSAPIRQGSVPTRP